MAEAMNTTSTWASQFKLQELPIPEVSSTITSLRTSLGAWARGEELWLAAHGSSDLPAGMADMPVASAVPSAATLQAAQQALLRHQSRAKAAGDSSWLIGWWTRLSYLTFRAALPVNSSYYYLLHATPAALAEAKALSAAQAQAARAARLAWQLLQARGAAENGLTVAPKLRAPLCNAGWPWLFSSERVPQPEADSVYVHRWAPAGRVGDKQCDAGGIAWHCCAQVPRGGALWRADVSYISDGAAARAAEHGFGLLGSGVQLSAVPWIAVAHAGRFWLVHTSPGTAAVHLQSAMVDILADAARPVGKHELCNVGLLTAQPRDEWTTARADMCSIAANEQALALLAGAAFLVVLGDDVQEHPAGAPSSTGLSDLALAALHGHGPGRATHDRWWDKTLQLVVWPPTQVRLPLTHAGKSSAASAAEAAPAALICEHALIDGHVTGSMMTALMEAAHRMPAIQSMPGRASGYDLKQVQALSFELPSTWEGAGAVPKPVRAARAFAAATATAQDSVPVIFSQYGAGAVKKWKVSPDAWMQMAIALAGARAAAVLLALRSCQDLRVGTAPTDDYVLWDPAAPADPAALAVSAQAVRALSKHALTAIPTYEPVQMRGFRRGRTECARAASGPTAAWISAAGQHLGWDAGSAGQRAAWDKLQAAANAHVAVCRAAVKGQGIDRHLLGLKLAAQESVSLPGHDAQALDEATSALAAPALGAASTWRISTSNVSGPWLAGWGWGQVAAQGWGVAYSTACSHGDVFMATVAARSDVPLHNAHLHGPDPPAAGGPARPVPRAAIFVTELVRALAQMGQLASQAADAKL